MGGAGGRTDAPSAYDPSPVVPPEKPEVLSPSPPPPSLAGLFGAAPQSSEKDVDMGGFTPSILDGGGGPRKRRTLKGVRKHSKKTCESSE